MFEASDRVAERASFVRAGLGAGIVEVLWIGAL